jgi:hypothetical protein
LFTQRGHSAQRRKLNAKSQGANAQNAQCGADGSSAALNNRP